MSREADSSTPEPRGGQPINIDADLWNADWLRTMRWHFTVTDADGDEIPVTTVRQLFEALGLEGKSLVEQRAAVEQFLSLPAFNPAPAVLRRELASMGYHVPARRIPLRDDDGANP